MVTIYSSKQISSAVVNTATGKWAALLLALLTSSAFAFEVGIEAYGKELGGVRHVNATQASQILQNHPTVKVLDVRTGFEFNRGHLSGATNINYYSFSFKKHLEKLDKKVTWLVHCRTGTRSSKSLPILKSLGFESIIHLDGGIAAWTKDGLPTTK